MTSASAAEPPSEGSVIAGKYRLESLLGEGGMGAVWRAFNLQLEVPVALKLLRADLGAAELGERLRVEARAAAKLTHPSIVRVFDIGEAESGDPFIVMELLVGESLACLLERGRLAPATALSLLLPIAEALSLAHSRGVVHRDLKPDNIFLASEGTCLQPKLLDFGIAKVTSTTREGGPTLTQTGTLLGSPDYMSPEQAYGRSDIDERSDVWSFCVVLYEAIAGRTPFTGDSCQTVLRSVVSDPTPPLSRFADVDPQLAALIERGLAKDRQARPPSIFSLGQQLASWLLAHGVSEDVTGSSIESKWLGRAEPGTAFPSGAQAPRAQHEQATLVSVAHPRPLHESAPAIELALDRRRGWLSGAAAAALLALLTAGGLWWKTRSVTPAASPQPVVLEAAQPLQVIAADTLPLEPAPSAKAEPPVAHQPDTPTVLAAVPSHPPTRRAQAAPKPRALPSTLPQAIPPRMPQATSARSSRADLLNPY